MAFYLVIPLLGALSAFLFSLSLIPSESPLDRTLSELRGGRDKQLGKMDRWDGVIAHVVSPQAKNRLQGMLMEAGWYTVTPARIFLRCAATTCAGVLVALLLPHFLHLPFALIAAFCALSVIVGAYAPFYALERAIEARKEQVQKTLPNFLDMLTSTVQAGLAMNAAMAYAVDAAPGALGSEIKEALSEVRLGRSRPEALKAAAERLNQAQFTVTITAITQAEKLGTNISKVLNEVAEDVRHQRITLVEEQAQKLPVKMAFPMAFFMLPTLFTIIFGTLAANYFATR